MGKINIKELVESVIEDLANNKPVSEFALKLKLIAGQLKNQEFSNWLKNELEGYTDVEQLPDYRIINSFVKANVFIDHIVKHAQLRDHTMPLVQLQDQELEKNMSKIRLTDSVISLEIWANDHDNGLRMNLTEYERFHLGKIYQNSTILDAWKPLSNTDCDNVVLKFKSTLLEIFVGFNDTVFNDELNFDLMSKRKDIDKVISQTIHAGVYIAENSTATITDSQIVSGDHNTLTLNQSSKKEIEGIVSNIENLSLDVANNREDIATEIANIRYELGNKVQRPKFLRSALNSIKGIAQDIAIETIKDKLILLADSALDKIKLLLPNG